MTDSLPLGCFSVSLSVKDIAASIAFYETLGFTRFHGDPAMGFVILANGETKIGLFQGMFEGNLLTFNPGWDQEAGALEEFTDVREIKRRLVAAGVEIDQDDKTDTPSGPAHIAVRDPDGNVILIDQHV